MSGRNGHPVKSNQIGLNGTLWVKWKAGDTDKGEIGQISAVSIECTTVGRPEGKKIPGHL